MRSILRNQQTATKPSTHKNSKGEDVTKDIPQYFHYKLNRSNNESVANAVKKLDAESESRSNPYDQHYFSVFNVNKSEVIHKIGQGYEDSQSLSTKAMTIGSKNTYQTSIIDVSFSANIKDPTGGDVLRIYTYQDGKQVELGASPYNLTPNPSDPTGITKFSFSFDFGTNRENIYFKVINNDGGKSSSPGAFMLDAKISGF